ncbi:PIG-L family deacetylase [Candidatus Woesearchaeota archaeon]|nr:PIG-L family deacetylase [Candidatus Woesearchaeota archaeon]
MAQKKKTILIIAPHPDDEIVGCGGVYLKNARAENNVFVLYITTGASKGEDRKAKLRREAVTTIAKENMIPANNLIFLDNDELGALLDIKRARKAVHDTAASIDRVQPDEVYVTAYEGGHIDHDLANLFVAVARKKVQTQKKTRYFEYEVYNNYIPFSLFGLKKILQMIVREVVKKITSTHFYWDESIFPPHKKSQPFMLSLNEKELKAKLELFERYRTLAEQPLDKRKPRKLLTPYKEADLIREIPQHDYSSPPHRRFPLPAGYELAFKIQFKQFKKLRERLK